MKPLSDLNPLNFWIVSLLYKSSCLLVTTHKTQWLTHSTEWIKGLLAVPFVLYSQPTGVFDSKGISTSQMAEEAHRRYAEILRDVEHMIDDHSKAVFLPLMTRIPTNVMPSRSPR